MRRRKDIAAILAEFDQPRSLYPDIFDRSERQYLLDAHPAVERKPTVIAPLDRIDIHHFRLERVEQVQADFDEVVEQLRNCTA